MLKVCWPARRLLSFHVADLNRIRSQVPESVALVAGGEAPSRDMSNIGTGSLGPLFFLGV